MDTPHLRTGRYVSLSAPGFPDLRPVSPLDSVSSRAYNVAISLAEGDHRVKQAEPGKVGAVPAARTPYLGKRLLDVVVGLVLSIVTLPIILVLATVSAVKFRTSPFFVQERIGLSGQPFRCVKIRSLPAETPAYLDETALNDHGHPVGWCRFLRRFHLDELAQFWHVVGGSMSLVGPRPMIASVIEGIPSFPLFSIWPCEPPAVSDATLPSR